ncbi:MAG: ABC transporter permease [Actinomycetota bacterium]
MASPALVIAGKDLRQRFRDRSAIVLAFVAPFLLSSIISLAFGKTTSIHATAAVADEGHGPVAAAFTTGLRSPDLKDLLTVRTVASEANARALITQKKVDVAFVVPAGFSNAVTSGGFVQLEVLTDVNHGVAAEIARSLADGFVAQVNADALSIRTALAAGAPHERATELAKLAKLAASLTIPASLVQQPVGAKELKTLNYYGPSMAIFFLFFLVWQGARGLVIERREGTLARLRAAPIRPGAIMAGKSLSLFVYGLAEMGVMWGATSLAFGASWGNPVGVAVLCIAIVTATVGLAGLVSTLARTEQQADGMSSMVVFGLALLGGNFIVISVAPSVIRTIALATPNGWAIRGFVDLATGGGIGTIATALSAVLAFAAVVWSAALLLSRRLVTR